MGDSIRPYFTFTPGERRGIVVLVILLVIVFIVRLLVPILFKPKLNATQTAEIVSFKIVLSDSLPSNDTKRFFDGDNSQYLKYSGNEKIDPNTASNDELISAGFPFQAVKNIIKYRSNGGYFKNVSDLRRIYGLDSAILNQLTDRIQIKQVNMGNQNELNNKLKNTKRAIIININKADSVEILEIVGVGKVLSKRILKYRESLGGFICKEQLKEVYGISTESYLEIESQIIIDTSFVKRLNINEVEKEKLRNHPYISDYQATAIIKYRNFKRKIKLINELKENNIFTEDEFSKIAPYLKVNR